MTKTEPLLSICIPTYNREKYLKRLLDSIVSQKEFTDTDDVEIVVDDGPSTDNTETMVKEYIKKYWDKIKYYRNPVRIWMCPAFLEALDLWTWKYLWLMWSDQVLMPKAINNILLWIKIESRIIIISNPRKWDWKHYNFCWLSDFLSYVWFYPNDFLDYEWWFLTFLGFCCLSRNYYLEAKKSLSFINEKELKNNYFNFNIIKYSELYAKNSIIYIDTPFFKPSLDAKSSWTINKKILKDLFFLIRYIENNYFVSVATKKVFSKIKMIRVGAYLALPFKKMCKLIHLEKVYLKLAWLYRLFLQDDTHWI